MAIACFRQALRYIPAYFGDRCVVTQALAQCYLECGEWSKAAATQKKALATAQTLFGKEHPHIRQFSETLKVMEVLNGQHQAYKILKARAIGHAFAASLRASPEANDAKNKKKNQQGGNDDSNNSNGKKKGPNKQKKNKKKKGK